MEHKRRQGLGFPLDAEIGHELRPGALGQLGAGGAPDEDAARRGRAFEAGAEIDGVAEDAVHPVAEDEAGVLGNGAQPG